MNTLEAQQTLNNYCSSHNGILTAESACYIAEFNIKCYHFNIPAGLETYINQYTADMTADFNSWADETIEHYRNVMMDGLYEEFKPSKIYVDGRMGGWLIMEFPFPTTKRDKISLANKIQRISEIVREERSYVQSEAFWQVEWELLRQEQAQAIAQQVEFNVPFPIMPI